MKQPSFPSTGTILKSINDNTSTHSFKARLIVFWWNSWSLLSSVNFCAFPFARDVPLAPFSSYPSSVHSFPQLLAFLKWEIRRLRKLEESWLSMPRCWLIIAFWSIVVSWPVRPYRRILPPLIGPRFFNVLIAALFLMTHLPLMNCLAAWWASILSLLGFNSKRESYSPSWSCVYASRA